MSQESPWRSQGRPSHRQREELQNTMGLFVDETWDALDSTASHKADGGIDDAVWYPREWLYYTKQSVNKTNFVRVINLYNM